MMKKKLIYLVMSLFSIAGAAAYGQSGSEVPRLSPEEQAAIEKSVARNPSKLPAVTAQVDPKADMTLELQPGPTNWRPVESPADDREVPEPNRVDRTTATSQAVTSSPDKKQPEGANPPGTTINRRDMKGQATQPEAPKAGSVINRRDMQGSKSQPEGEKPAR